MTSYLQRIRFTKDSKNFANQIGFQETDRPGGRLLHLYDENGEQLDTGSFPNATWGVINGSSCIEDSDDFWEAVESLRLLPL